MWWKLFLHNVDTLTVQNGALGAAKGLCANRTRRRAIFRELWAIYCVGMIGPWAEDACCFSWYLHSFRGSLRRGSRRKFSCADGTEWEGETEEIQLTRELVRSGTSSRATTSVARGIKKHVGAMRGCRGWRRRRELGNRWRFADCVEVLRSLLSWKSHGRHETLL